MYRITNTIGDYLERQDLKLSRKEVSNLSYLELSFELKTGDIKIRVISSSEESVKIQTEDFANFPVQKLALACQTANALNNQYKYIKFRIDTNDGAISADFDIPLCVIKDGKAGPVAYEIIIRMASIIEDALPVVKKQI